MQRRDAASSLVAHAGSRRFNAKHQDTLELERALFAGGARRVIANSQMVKREAEEFYGYPAEQIDVVPNGVPLADFRPDPGGAALRRKILRLRRGRDRGPLRRLRLGTQRFALTRSRP